MYRRILVYFNYFGVEAGPRFVLPSLFLGKLFFSGERGIFLRELGLVYVCASC